MCTNETNYNRPEMLNFILGERKIVQFEVISTKNEPVIIVDATWILTYQDETVASGDVTITEDSTMEVTLEPPERGTYDLVITYTIAPEVRKVRCKVLVH